MFGRHMADFCRSYALPDPYFAADLATLEWAIVLAIHAPTAPPLILEDFARIPIENWAATRFVPNPSLRLLSLAYPVNAYFVARQRGEKAVVPAAKAISVAVYRTGRTVWRVEMLRPMVMLVESLARGGTLGDSLSVAAAQLEGTPETEAGRTVTSWFRQAMSSGLFSGVRSD
jgi:hypothetical protein